MVSRRTLNKYEKELAILVEKLVDKGHGNVIIKNELHPSNSKGKKEKNIFNAIIKKILSIILELGPTNAKQTNADNLTPLLLSCLLNYYPAVKMLIPYSNVDAKDNHGNNSLLLAATGDSRIIQELISANINVNYKEPNYGETALMRSSSSGAQQNVEILLSNGANKSIKNKYGFTAYDLAEIEGHNNLLKLLKIPSEA